jgi:hypothetical protein
VSAVPAEEIDDDRAADGLTVDHRRRILRRALASALRTGRHDHLVTAEAATTQRKPPEVGGVLVGLLLWWCASATSMNLAALPWWSLPLVVIAIPVALGLVARVLGQGLVVALLVAAFAAGFLAELERGHVWVTYGIPVVAAVALGIIASAINPRSTRDIGVAIAAFVRSAPLLAPLALVVLVLPAFSADLWQAAAKLDQTDLIILFAVTILPLFVVVGRQLNAQLAGVVANSAERLATSQDRGDATLEMLRERLDTKPYELVEFTASQQAGEVWPDNSSSYAPLVAASEGGGLGRSLWVRLALCALVVGVALTVYLYVILATVIDPVAAHAWAGQHVPTWDLRVLGTDIYFPGGVFLRVVGLLGTLATATFLAFALLEDRFSTALGDALLRLPVDRLLVLAVPYLALREERVASDDADYDEWDPGTLVTEDDPVDSVPAGRMPAASPS